MNPHASHAFAIIDGESHCSRCLAGVDWPLAERPCSMALRETDPPERPTQKHRPHRFAGLAAAIRRLAADRSDDEACRIVMRVVSRITGNDDEANAITWRVVRFAHVFAGATDSEATAFARIVARHHLCDEARGAARMSRHAVNFAFAPNEPVFVVPSSRGDHVVAWRREFLASVSRIWPRRRPLVEAAIDSGVFGVTGAESGISPDLFYQRAKRGRALLADPAVLGLARHAFDRLVIAGDA